KLALENLCVALRRGDYGPLESLTLRDLLRLGHAFIRDQWPIHVDLPDVIARLPAPPPPPPPAEEQQELRAQIRAWFAEHQDERRKAERQFAEEQEEERYQAARARSLPTGDPEADPDGRPDDH